MRGMRGLTCAMISDPFSAALLTMSTETPRLTLPWMSGGVTWISTASRGICPESKRCGMSMSMIGV